jgi:Fungal specific transcription factor domain
MEQLTPKEFTFKNRFASNFKHESKLESSANMAVAIPWDAPSSSTIFAVSTRNLVVGAHCRQLFGTILSHDDIHSWVEPRDHLLAAIAAMPNPSRALNISVLAFCTAKLSRISKDPTLAKDSSRLYGGGLRELQRALWDPKQMYKDDTLGACVLMALYEIYECPSGSRQGYKSHIDGCAMLMQKRGPAAHSTGLGHSVFSFFRVMAVSFARPIASHLYS